MLLERDHPYGTGIDAPFGDPAVQDELSIALGAPYHRTDEANRANSGVGQRHGRLLDRERVDFRVAHNPTSAHELLPDLELGLDEEHPIGAFGSQRSDVASNESQRYEGEIGHYQVERSAERGGIDMTDVRSFNNHDPRIGSDSLMKLTIPNVERHHPDGPALQEAVGESPGRRTHIDRSPSVDCNTEHFDRVVEFRPGPADEPCRWTRD